MVRAKRVRFEPMSYHLSEVKKQNQEHSLVSKQPGWEKKCIDRNNSLLRREFKNAITSLKKRAWKIKSLMRGLVFGQKRFKHWLSF